MYGLSEYNEEDFLQLSGLQHFLFCRRQWALTHVESQWAENLRTVEGNLMHERTHNEALTEKCGDIIITRGMNIFSRRLGVSGKCDVLEFHRSDKGVSVFEWEGLWSPYPVEYKRGEPKENNCDAAQLCGQAICLEEMLCCEIKSGSLFYGEIRRRTTVEFTPKLRAEVTDSLKEMHEYYNRGYTPKVKTGKFCIACSLNEICLPVLMKKTSVADYMRDSI